MNKLWSVSYICKDVWNILNEERRNAKTNYYKQKKRLTDLKAQDERFSIPSSQVLQEVVKSLNTSWKMFFTKRKNGDKEVRPPRFKSYKYFFTQKYPQREKSFKIENNILYLAYGKRPADWIKVELPDGSYSEVKTVTIFYDKVQKKWYASLTYYVPEKEYIGDKKAIYFDPGCKTTLTGIKTDLTLWEYDINPLRELNLKHYKLIDTLKSKRDKKKKGSKAWRRLNSKIRKLYRKINTQTKHYLHKLANKILEDHPDVSYFGIGSWNKKQTLADTGIAFVDKYINRQVQNNNPVMTLIKYLNYKAKLSGRKVEKFDEANTTRTCSKCGYVLTGGLFPSQRVFNCPKCGFAIERDVNSTLNFLKIHQYALWQGLRDMTALSIARISLSPSSGKNRKVLKRTLILNYQDARCL
ncbi:transposase [Candidatus Aerophobetes bacterium]|nr:transposase [Candidatus Aerophobetes bacterium]